MDFSQLIADFASTFQQANRILRLRFAANSGIADDALLPESLAGSEQLSQCYRYTLTCLSPDAALELKHFNGQPVEIAIELPDSSERSITGLVSSSHQLSSDGGFARYELTIEPALALLRERRAARVFQDQSVMQIIGQILDEHRAANPIFQQSFAWQADLSKEYPSRSYCIQYRESDLEFIQRLAAEEGISYRFQYTPGDNPLHTVIFFDDPLSLPQNPQSNLRFGHAEPGLDKNPGEDVVKQWNGSRQLVPGLTSLASYDYKPVVTHHTQANSRIDAGDAGTDAQASLESYDPQTQYYGADSDEVQRYAALRQDAKDAQAKHFSGQSQVRDLHLGHWFTLDNHPVHDQDLPREREFLVTGFTLQAKNNLVNGEQGTVNGKNTSEITDHRSPNHVPYQNSFTAVRRGIPVHPSPITKPSAPGMQTATVVGPANEEIHTDEHGRIKLQFHWQRPQDHPQGTANLDDKSSTWVRVAHSSAGANWGSQFIPRIGQEVLVDFIEGDIDRPVVVGLAHNGRNMPASFSGAGTLPANKTLSGIKS
jgi:type VI secretion system secreted protein VgrG